MKDAGHQESRRGHQESRMAWDSQKEEDSEDPDKAYVGSFRRQLDYLLTSQERSRLKQALEVYVTDR